MNNELERILQGSCRGRHLSVDTEGNHEKLSVRISGAAAEILAEHVQKISQKRSRYTSLFGLYVSHENTARFVVSHTELSCYFVCSESA
jgi:hypothetical protein